MNRPVFQIPRFIIRALCRAGFVNLTSPNIIGDPARLYLHRTVKANTEENLKFTREQINGK